MPLPDRRRHRRSLCSEIVELTFEDQTGRIVRQTGLLEDLSKRGACLNLPIPLGVGRDVRLAANGFERGASVRYCELADDGYTVGLEFAAGSDWDRNAWKPGHLTSIEE